MGVGDTRSSWGRSASDRPHARGGGACLPARSRSRFGHRPAGRGSLQRKRRALPRSRPEAGVGGTGGGGRAARRRAARRKGEARHSHAIVLPKQRVAGSSPVSRSNTPHEEETGPPQAPPMRRRSPTICLVSRMTVRRSAATAAAADAPPLADHLLSEQDDGAARSGHRRRRHGGRCARRVQPGRPSAGPQLSARRPPEGRLPPYQPPDRYQRYRMVSVAIGLGPGR